jgi:hypothetical protein
MATALRVGILPARALTQRARLLGALEAAEPVRFVAAGADVDVDAVVVFGPCDVALPAGVPVLVAAGDEAAAQAPRAVGLGAALELPLRGAQLSDRHAAPLPATVLGPAPTVLASVDGLPAWIRAGEREIVSCAPDELGPGEALRERLAPGRCLALLALVHFLRAAAGERRSAPLRAAFVVDDPNLRWPSYGHLRYRELLAHAREHDYHLAVAMVPLDAWLTHRGTARLFREGAARLSVCVHGNDHDGPELGRPRDDAEGIALAAQALARMAAFEHRTGVAVSRVMVPPHERVSEPAARALLACRYEAICTTRPYPWVTTSEDMPWLARPADVGPTAAWRTVDIVAGGLPLLLRSSFEHPREDLVLRAFLGQPLILYGHHDAFAGGLDVLAEAAADVNRLGDVRWQSLSAIAAGATAALNGAGPRPVDRQPAGAAHSLRPRLRPLARRLASEGRDRGRALLS